MPGLMSVRFDLAPSIKALTRIEQRAPIAIARALNRAMTSARVVVGQAVAKDMGIKASDARSGIRINLATATRHAASLSASPKRLPLEKFGANQTARGVTYRNQGGRKRIDHAFLATMASGHRGAFLRKGKARLPIRELFGPSIWQSAVTHIDAGRARAEEQLVKNLKSEFRFAVLQAGGE